MPRLTPIAGAVLALFAPWIWADETAPAPAPALRLSNDLTTSPPAEGEVLPVFIRADRIDGQVDAYTEACGDAEFRQRGQAVTADRMRFDQRTEMLDAQGNVRLIQGPDSLSAPSLTLNTSDRTGRMVSPRYVMGSVGGAGQAAELAFEGRDRYRLKQATYSTCRGPAPDWYIAASELSLDYGRNVGEATNARIVFKGVPVMYSPWMDFSLNGERKSGLLPPTFGTTSAGGAEVTLPYYFNLAPNRDATFAPRVTAKRGVMLKGEFRYLEPHYSGELQGDWLDDRVAGRNRYAARVEHRQSLWRDWNLSIDAQHVSDNDYYRDLGSRLAVTAQTQLPTDIALSYSKDGLSFTARTLKYQTLQDPDNPIEEPYAKLPELALGWYRPGLGPTDANLTANFTANFTAFRHPSKVDGRRVVLYPSLTLPLSTSYAYFKPRLGVHHTAYRLDANSGLRSASRTLPIFSVDSGLIFERDTAWQNQPHVQTLEPRLYYVRIPYRDQSALPNFDSGTADISFAQLFSENRYTGSDRINEANQVTAAVTSRLVDAQTGVERARLSVGQRYYFHRTQRVTIDTPAFEQQNSDLLAEASAQLTQAWRAGATWQYNPKTRRSGKLNLELQYQPAPGKVVNLAYRMDRTPSAEEDRIREVDLSGQWPLSTNWYGVARVEYSLKDKKALETLAGLEYRADCWVVRLVAQRYVKSGGGKASAMFLQLELGDIARVGNNPLDLLRRTVAGYQPVQNEPAPATSELYR